MEQFKFCRICLVTDVKMYSLDITSNESIGVIYSQLAQIRLTDRDQHVCFECASLLQKCQMFKSKCLRTHNILSYILVTSKVLTKQIIQNIDRKKNNLESNLIISPIEFYCEPFDEFINANLQTNCIVLENCYKDNNLGIVIKSEVTESHDENDLVNGLLKTHNFNEDCAKDTAKELQLLEKPNEKCNLIISPNEFYCEPFDEFINANSQTNCIALEDCYPDNKLGIVVKSEVTENHEENDLVNDLLKTHNFYEDCVKDTTEELLEEPNEKCEAINEQESKETESCDILATKTDTDNLLIVVNDPLDDYNNDNVFLSSDDIIPNDTVESVTDNLKTTTIQKTISKKRKAKIALQSDDDFSDNKLLSKRTKITKNANKCLDKDSRLNLDFFDDYVAVVSLTPDDAKKELLSKKESENYKISLFKCDFCYKGYGAKATYDNHMKKHAVENGDYECMFCHLRFSKPIYLCKHKLSCHKRKFSCKLCPYICYSMSRARIHVLLHKGKKYPCKDCGEIFSMPNTLIAHKHKKHLNNSMAESVCDLCGDIFNSAKGVSVHQSILHRTDINNKKGPKCEECNVHFTSEVAWKRHLVLSTRHIVVNGCKYCGESFTTVEELNSHKRKQHKDRRFTYKSTTLPGSCRLCQKWLRNQKEYKSHMRVEHPQSRETKILNKTSSNIAKYVCEVCGQSFKNQCFLIHHQRKHTGERPYKCKDCGKTYQMAQSLKIHQMSHTNFGGFECDVCNKMLATNNSLRKHKKLHEGIRPYKCTICGKGFINKCDVKVHIKYSHENVPWPKKKSKTDIADNSGLHTAHNN